MTARTARYDQAMAAICRVIAGVSGSPRCLPALRYAAALAHGQHAVLVPVLTWVPPGDELADRKCPCRYLREEWERAAWERLRDALAAAFGGEPADVITEPLVIRGEPGPVLVHAASQAGDLLVIGTGRHGRLARIAGGKVSRYCLAHAVGPVLAVPPSALEIHSQHRLSGWALWHHGMRELTAEVAAQGCVPGDPRSAA
jgi:nucleotide-binding universal stress UspA family protein